MSNVLERFRSVSEMEFYRKGQDILHETRTFLMNEKNVPKRSRALYAYPIINMVQSMIEASVTANRIYAYKPEELERRKRLFQISIEYVDTIYLRLQSAMTDLWKDTLCCELGNPKYNERLRIEMHIGIIGTLLIEEEKLLKGCKAKSKLLKQRK